MPLLADAAELDAVQQRPISPNVQLIAAETPLGDGFTGLTSPGGRSLAPGSVPEEFREWIVKAAQTCEAIDASLLASQLYAENQFRYGPSSPVSPAGARGPGQFMPATWAWIGQDYDGDGVADVNSIGAQQLWDELIDWVE